MKNEFLILFQWQKGCENVYANATFRDKKKLWACWIRENASIRLLRGRHLDTKVDKCMHCISGVSACDELISQEEDTC